MTQYRLLQIDSLKKPDHSYLRDDDDCLYLMEYFSHKGYGYSPENSFIQNLKKSVTRKALYEYRFKSEAITKATILFKTSVLPAIENWGPCTFVPIPCSKEKTDSLYDDRVEQFTSNCLIGSHHNFAELFKIRESRPATHESDLRLRPDEHMELLDIDLNIGAGTKDTIILVDDVITTGSQFVACKDLILRHYPHKLVVGIFLARRNVPPNEVLTFKDL